MSDPVSFSGKGIGQGAIGGVIGAGVAMVTSGIIGAGKGIVEGTKTARRPGHLIASSDPNFGLGSSNRGAMSDLEIEAYSRELRTMISMGEIDAVEGLARLAEVLANRYAGWNDDETGFVNHFQRLLTEGEGMFARAHGNPYTTSFGGSGFAQAYFDGSAQQSRHFVGFMAAGYYGKLPGVAGALLWNGDSAWDWRQPDTALGYKAGWLGTRLKGGPFYNLSLKDVPDYIRKEFRD